MFWATTVRDDDSYCTCYAGWKTMRISHVNIENTQLEIYMTPSGGERCLVYRATPEQIPILTYYHNFNSWQHVKIEVTGGEVTFTGSTNGVDNKFRPSERFPPHCVFGGEENWGREVEVIPVDRRYNILRGKPSKTQRNIPKTINHNYGNVEHDDNDMSLGVSTSFVQSSDAHMTIN